MSLERALETDLDRPASVEPVAAPATKLRPTPPMVPHAGRLPALDGLRAFSILIVMLSHAGLGGIVPGGLGVTIFFFISGLLITRLLLQEIEESGAIRLREFYIRRFLRLQPALVLYVVVASAALALIGTRPYWQDILACLFYVGNYYQIFHGDFLHPIATAPGGEQITIQTPFGIVWSLAIEEHFYIVFPFVVAFFARSPARLFGVLACICVLALARRGVLISQGADPIRTYMGTDTRIDSIIYGALLAVAMSTNKGRLLIAKAIGSRVAFLAGIAVILVTLAIRNPVFRETARYSLQGIALAPIIYGIVFAPKNTFIRSIFSHAASVYVGKLSYSLYLYHYAAFMIASWCAATYGFPMYGVSWTLVGIPLTIIGATFSYHLVETQFFRLRRRFGSTV